DPGSLGDHVAPSTGFVNRPVEPLVSYNIIESNNNLSRGAAEGAQSFIGVLHVGRPAQTLPRNRLRVRHVLFYEGTPAAARIHENIRVVLDFYAQSASLAAAVSYSLARRDRTLQIWSPVPADAVKPVDGPESRSTLAEPEFRP
ncbi:hypothetical protein HK405_000667, partial [Cladochytrium tenue]